MARVGIVAALHAEAHSLGCGSRHTTSIAETGGCLVRVSGIGHNNARTAAQTLLDAGAAALVSWGYCGGLDPHLTCGTLILPDTVATTDGRPFRTDSEWRARLLHQIAGRLAISSGVIAESIELLADAHRKQLLFERSGAVAVDMESAAVAEVAAQARVPFIVIRAILDTAGRNLPRQVLRAVDSTGNVRAARLAAALAAFPGEWPDLVRAARAARTARRTLSTVGAITGPQLAFADAPTAARDLAKAL